MKAIVIIMVFIAFTFLSGCSEYLDAKPNREVVVVESLRDVEALMDNVSLMNGSIFIGLTEMAADDYALGTNIFQARPEFEQRVHTWHAELEFATQQVSLYWMGPYKAILAANVCIETLDELKEQGLSEGSWRRLRGEALFVRAFAHFNLAQAYAEPYTGGDAEEKLGIPLRFTSNFDVPTSRSTLEETYTAIRNDIEEAITLLPDMPQYPTRASRWAAYTLLARVSLIMGRYVDAAEQASNALAIANTLLDYVDFAETSTRPFSALNAETIFFGYSGTAPLLLPNRAHVVDELVASYNEHDLRKKLFFIAGAEGKWVFKGQYTGSTSTFMGLTVAELLLIRSECYARQNDLDAAAKDLNTLLSKRIDKEHFKEYSGQEENFLDIILNERRKELLFRGVRWSDIRRYNQDPDRKITLKRELWINDEEVVYTLPPGDPRFIFPIPQEVIERTGIEQNPR